MAKEIVVSCLIIWLTYELTSSTFRAGRSTKRGSLMMYSRMAILLGYGFIIFAFVIAFSILVTPGITTGGMKNAAIASMLMLIPGGWLLSTTARGPILITAREIIRIKRRGSRERIRWREVAIVKRSVLGLGYRVQSINGQVISVSDLLVGQKQFAASVLNNVPEHLMTCESSLQRRRS